MKIKINKIKIFGYHGLYEIEKKKGQKFVISAEIELMNKNNYMDDIDNTVDYTEIIHKIKNVFNANRYSLIETLSIDISNKIMEDQAIKSVIISIKKISPPIEVDLESVEVEHRNERE